MVAVGCRSFTLVEFLVACVVIFAILGIFLGFYGLIIDRVRIAKTSALVKQLSVAMQAYREDQGYYFSNTSSYDTITTPGEVGSNNYFVFNVGSTVDTEFVKLFDYEKLLSAGYIKSSGTDSYFIDAWNVPLIYKSPGSFNPEVFDLGSVGKDGMYGNNSNGWANFGKGDDITNFNF